MKNTIARALKSLVCTLLLVSTAASFACSSESDTVETEPVSSEVTDEVSTETETETETETTVPETTETTAPETTV